MSPDVSGTTLSPPLAACDCPSSCPGSRGQVTPQGVLCKFPSTSVPPTQREPPGGLGGSSVPAALELGAWGGAQHTAGAESFFSAKEEEWVLNYVSWEQINSE